MPTLAEHFSQTPKRKNVIADLAHLVDEEVAAKSGLSGFAIKGAYAMVKAVKPGFITEVIDGMFDDWIARLEPLYTECSAAGGNVAGEFQKRAPRVADALLSVTDDRAKKTTHQTAKKAYEKLRPTAKRNVEEAVPRLSKLLAKHTAAA